MKQTKITRAIRIDDNTYQAIKQYCEENVLKMSKWVGKIVMEKIDEEKKKKNQ